MINVICSNPICGKSFMYDEEKFPNAKKVQCPHCKTLQALAEKSADDDWFKPQPPKEEQKPTKPVPSPEKEPPAPVRRSKPEKVEEDFDVAPSKKESRGTAPQVARPLDPHSDPMGWLVIHDEHTDRDTFSLRFGKNAIGRISNTTPKEVNIGIQTEDTYMSRYHFDIVIALNQEKTAYEYKLSDGALGNKKPAANGTFLNGKGPIRASDIKLLKDGDTIQAGRTKLVLKMPGKAKNAQDAVDQVGPTDYFQTIIQ